MLTKTQYLVFREGKHKFSRFTKEGFGHVGVLICDDFNWMYIDPQNYYLSATILPYVKDDDVPKIMRSRGFKVLMVTTTMAGNEDYRFRFFALGQYCVTIAKYITGIKLWCFTPYSLYRKLMKMGATKKYHGDVVKVKYII